MNRGAHVRMIRLAPLLLGGAVLGCTEPVGTNPDPFIAPVTTPGGIDPGNTPPDPTTPEPPTEPEEVPEVLCQITVECGGGILDEPKTPCSMTVADGQGVVQYEGDAGFELRGRSSATFPKPHFGAELRTHSEMPVWPGGTWSYLDDGSDQGTAWRDPVFDDSSWTSASAPMGYGGDYLDTELADPNGASLTTYFRREFTPADLPSITELLVGLQARDGAAVYLNGTEILRHNLAVDADYDDPASTPVDGDTPWIAEKIGPELVVEGTNVLAVEVHLSDATREELRFNFYLEAAGDDAPTALLGMGREEDWILNGQYVDRALFRNRLAFDLFQSLGDSDRYATDTRFCELELDGEYMGVYTLGEKLERDDDRIDIGEGATPGESFIVKLDDEEGFHPNGVGHGMWQLVYPDPSPGAEATVRDFLVRWEQAIHGPDPADPDTGIFSIVDLDSAVDWVLLNEFLLNHDAYILSVYLWKDETGKMFFAPWDLDLSMGYPYTDCDATGWLDRDWYPGDGEVRDIEFVEAMTEVPAFHDRFVERWNELRETELSEEALLARVAAYDETLAPGIPSNVERWPIEEIAFSFGGVDNWLCPVTSYEEEHARTVGFITDRLAWMDANLESFF